MFEREKIAPDLMLFLGDGQRQNAVMRVLYRRCQLFVTATEVEACPNIAIEALTAGCSIVASDSGPAREILGDASVLTPPRNVDALGHQMVRLLGDDMARVELANKARMRSGMFSWDRTVRDTYEVLTKW